MNPNKYERKFKGVWIPKEIWTSENLSVTEKCLLTEIDSLDNADGCIAGNAYFAKFFKISSRQISKYIGQLEEKHYIKTEAMGRNRRRILMEQKFRTDRTNVPSADRTKVPHNNTEENNTYNIPQTPNKFGGEVYEIINFFEGVNPSYKILKERPNQKQAVERLLKIYGREKLELMIKALPTINAKQYWPKSTTPAQLENNLAVYKAKNEEQRSKNKVINISL